MKIELHNGNNIDVLKTFEDNSIDSVVTDPPYGLGKEPDVRLMLQSWLEFDYMEVSGGGFMGKKWDAFVPQPIFWKEVFRLLKPGGHCLAFYGTRTYDWGVMAMRLAGFEIRDTIMWLYGSGFPKSLNIGKAVDKILGNEREKTGILKKHAQKGVAIAEERGAIGGGAFGQSKIEEVTKGNSDWEGWGTALKPAVEPIVMARKPISEKNIAENVLRWHTGGINIDGCRVETDENLNGGTYSDGVYVKNDIYGQRKKIPNGYVQPLGRFPANLIHDGSEEVVAGFPEVDSGGKKTTDKANSDGLYGFGGQCLNNLSKSCGSASRFFYTAKAHSSERNYGLEGFEEKRSSNYGNNGFSSANPTFATASNHHPTVKPLDLMQYLVRLVTPKNGICLDPFMGSGTTGMACKLEHFDFIGIELDPEYFKIAKARIDAVGEVTEVKLDNGKLF